MPLSVKEACHELNLFFKSGVCTCTIAEHKKDNGITFNVSMNSVIIIPLFIF